MSTKVDNHNRQPQISIWASGATCARGLMKNKNLPRKSPGIYALILFLTAYFLAALLTAGYALPLQAAPTPPKPAPPKPTSSPTFAYVPVLQPTPSVQQYRQTADGSLKPLKPFLVATQSKDIPVSITDPTQHFVYLGTSPLRQFRIGGTGQLVPLIPATVALPRANEMAFTPNGRFLYLSRTHYTDSGPTNTPDDLIPCRVDKDGTIHPIKGAAIQTGPQVFTLAVDHTGQYLYVCVYNYDPSGNLAYTMMYHIHKDGTLTLLPTDEYNCLPAPTTIQASPSGAVMYMGSKQGLSVWKIKADGTLHLQQSNTTAMKVPAFTIDARDHLIIGIGEPVTDSDFGADRLVIWRQLADGTLTEIYAASVGDDGFLYGDEKDMKKRESASLIGLAYDAERSLLYARDRSTSRIFRYAVLPSGLLQLQIPWLNIGVTGLEKLQIGPEENPIFLGK